MKRYSTSASNIDQRRLCPGSARMEAPYADEDSEYSEEGTMLHALFMTGQRPPTLTFDQIDALDMADFYAGEFLRAVRDRFSIPDDARFIDEREVALVFLDADGKAMGPEGEVLPGHADLIRTWPDHDARAIIDAKFGYRDVPEASNNYQLAAYAVMRHQQGPMAHTGVAIVQPRNFGTRITQAFYTATGIGWAASEIESIFLSALSPNAPIVAGEKQCHFCRAKAVCEAYRAKFTQVTEVRQSALDTMPAEKVAETWEMVRFAEKLEKPLRAKMLKLIEKGALPEYTLKPGNKRREITDTLKAFTILAERFDAPDLDQMFMRACKFSPAEMKPLLAAATGKKQTEVERTLREALAPITSESQNAPSITRAGEIPA